jgi:hypothetical protein
MGEKAIAFITCEIYHAMRVRIYVFRSMAIARNIQRSAIFILKSWQYNRFVDKFVHFVMSHEFYNWLQSSAESVLRHLRSHYRSNCSISWSASSYERP